MTERYPTTNSIDGTRRVSFKVDLRMTLEEMAAHLVIMNGEFYGYGVALSNIDDDLIDKTVTSRTWVIAEVSESVRRNGIETPAYRVGDDNLKAVVERVLKRLEEIWNS